MVFTVVFVPEQDHEVQEDKIMLVSLLMAELGVHSVAYAFPKVKIITTAVDKSLDDFLHVIPGIGKPITHTLPLSVTCLDQSGSQDKCLISMIADEYIPYKKIHDLHLYVRLKFVLKVNGSIRMSG